MASAPRLLEIAGEEALRRELLRIGAEPAEATQLAADLDGRFIRIAEVPLPVARRLREQLFSLGGRSALVAGAGKVAELILAASTTALRMLAERLAGEPDGPAELARDLAGLLRALDRPPAVLAGRTCRLPLNRPLVMGVLNVTPDSFSDGGRFLRLEEALERGRTMASAGADLIDIGGESTRPGAVPVSAEEEMARVLPVIEALAGELPVPLSVDTAKAPVARAAVAAGAEFVNDISGLEFDPAMVQAVAASGAGLFLMHTRGRPDRMQQDTAYADLMGEVVGYLRRSLERARAAGIPEEKLAVDPGIGFGKDTAGNLEILSRLGELRSLGRPVLLGTSRKRFIGQATGRAVPEERLAGTLATVALGVAAGAHLVRVHDVGPAREAALMAWAVRHGQLPFLD